MKDLQKNRNGVILGLVSGDDSRGLFFKGRRRVKKGAIRYRFGGPSTKKVPFGDDVFVCAKTAKIVTFERENVEL